MAAAVRAARGTRNAGMLNLALVVLALAILVPLALIASQQPPPAIAEFAPQAQQRINQAPPGQTSKSGQTSAGGEILGQAVPSPSASPDALLQSLLSPSPQVIDVNKVYSCVGGHQTEDPQSPPCVPFFAGPNGGSTYPHGVTGSDIRIAWEGYPDLNSPEAKDLQAYFNRRFQFYGRKIVLTDGISQILFGNALNPQNQQKTAEYLDRQAHAFGAMSFTYSYGGTQPFFDEMARRNLVAETGFALQTSEEHINVNAPYQWSTTPPLDKQERYLGDFFCHTLAHKPARFAPPQVTARYPQGIPERHLAVLRAREGAGGQPFPDSTVLNQTMQSECGASIVADSTLDLNGSTQEQQTAATSFISDATNKDATTFLCLGDPDCYAVMMRAASSQQRHPEWLVNDFTNQDKDIYMYQKIPPDQSRAIIGLQWQNKRIPIGQTQWFAALHEVDPNYQLSSNTDYIAVAQDYTDLLLLASGIQLAGPNLTAQSFSDGLMRARFDNSTNGAAPQYEARVGFTPGDHSEYQDVSMVWWSSAAQSTDGPQAGTYCYVAHGQRFTFGNFPADDSGFYNGTACQ